jgi:hypothetical protein
MLGYVLSAIAPIFGRNEAPIKLRLIAPAKAIYRVERHWRATPKHSGNGNQDHVLRIRLAVSRHQEDVSIIDFSGTDSARYEDRHLKEIAPEVQRIRIARVVSELGLAGARQRWGGENAGWAGAMVDKALGAYEVGPFDLSFPREPISVGASWTYPLRLGDESFFSSPDMARFDDIWTVIRFRLKKVDLKTRRAQIEFSAKGRPSAVYRRSILYPRHQVQLDVVQTGIWTIDLDSGLPVRYESSRTEKREGLGLDETERTSTTMVRV